MMGMKNEFFSLLRAPALCLLTALLSGCATTGSGDGLQEPVAVVLQAFDGRVLVSNADKYVVAEPDMAVRPDDRVITLSGASATLMYIAIDEQGQPTGPTCSVIIPEDSQLTVAGGRDCASANIISNSSADESSPGSDSS